MPVQTSKFGRPTPARRHRGTLEEIHLEAGLHSGVAPHKLPPGFSPSLQNLINKDDGRVGIRNGLSAFGTYNFGGPVLGAAEVYDIFGNLGGFAPSKVASDSSFSFAYMHKDAQVWSNLSYVDSTVVADSLVDITSGLSTDYWSTAVIYEPSSNSNIAVTSNNTAWTKFFYIHSDTTLYSDFTWTDSLASTKASKGVTAIDDRLVFFNVLDSAGTRFPTRVLWSARGDPLNYAIASGAGAEDLKDMRGYGQAAKRYRELMILFSDQEIWRGLPTRDAYAFRFERVTDQFGCTFPRSIAETAYGIVFLGKDYEVYLTDGGGVRPLGPVNGTGSSRIQKKLRDEITNPDRLWGLFNQTQNRYELYYATVTSTDGFPNAALFYNFEDQTWWPQKFSQSLTNGIDLEDPADLTTWDDISATWDATAAAWDNYNETFGSRSVNVFDSTGSTYRFRSTKTTDDTSAIDCRWRSPALNSNDNTKLVNIYELFIDYQLDNPSTASVYLSDNFGDTFDSGYSFSLGTTSRTVFVPIWDTARHPQFEIRVNNGVVPNFQRMQASLRASSRF
jgi:hypothetical protein